MWVTYFRYNKWLQDKALCRSEGLVFRRNGDMVVGEDDVS